ncbi:hypothetical protein HHI36_017943 [Cryptolaemus montrouzieri]|uniref:Uncharacterized protein n=1 Tax=Cryptolaemus montrouzieri TaxID=559131 RepID=A0ABD2NYR0_9CUCU
MASCMDHSVELMKLKKKFSIEIIITKKKVTQELRDFIVKSETVSSVIETCENNINNDDNLQRAVKMLNLKNDMKVAQVELNCANSMVIQLPKWVSDKDLIIKFLNNNQNNSSSARFPDTRVSNVAVMNNKSQGVRQNIISNSSVRENRAKSFFGVGAAKRPDTSASKTKSKE